MMSIRTSMPVFTSLVGCKVHDEEGCFDVGGGCKEAAGGEEGGDGIL